VEHLQDFKHCARIVLIVQASVGCGCLLDCLLVSTLDYCPMLQGRRLLRQWFLRPVVQLDVVSNRHDAIELLLAAPTTNDALRAVMKKVCCSTAGSSSQRHVMRSHRVIKAAHIVLNLVPPTWTCIDSAVSGHIMYRQCLGLVAK
jgi:hypothetical protein